MSDITNLFRATVKAVKLREHNLQLIDKPASAANGNDAKITPLKSPATSTASHPVFRSEFTAQAYDVVSNIKKLQEFLQKYRKDYINAGGQLGGEPCQLSDAERDQIDLDAELYIKSCADSLRQLKKQANNNKVLRQVKDHKDAVLDIIDKYLCAVCQLYSEQKAVRVKRVVDRKRIARLEKDSMPGAAKHNKQAGIASCQSQSTGDAKANVVVDDHISIPQKDADDIPLSAEEEQMLQMENKQVFEEMSGMVDEVRQIEGKLVEIARLQEIFAEKVLQQETDINKIADTVVGTTENIKDANEEIREAMKNNAGFRIWILFFLIMCSFSLLFLDWYNA